VILAESVALIAISLIDIQVEGFENEVLRGVNPPKK
jgi:hypothetical protein